MEAVYSCVKNVGASAHAMAHIAYSSSLVRRLCNSLSRFEQQLLSSAQAGQLLFESHCHVSPAVALSFAHSLIGARHHLKGTSSHRT